MATRRAVCLLRSRRRTFLFRFDDYLDWKDNAFREAMNHYYCYCVGQTFLCDGVYTDHEGDIKFEDFVKAPDAPCYLFTIRRSCQDRQM